MTLHQRFPTEETVAEAVARRDALARRLPAGHTPYQAGMSGGDRMALYIAMLDADAAVQRAHREAKRIPLVVTERVNGGVML